MDCTRGRVIRTAAAAVALLVSVSGLVAQGTPVSATVSVNTPSPFMADWTTAPGLATMIVTNQTGTTVSATVAVRFLQGRAGLVGTGPSDITQVASTPTSVFTAPQIARWLDVVFTGAVGNQLKASGRLPEGSYTLCVDFTNMSTPSGALPNATACTNFFLTYPQPPKLIAPMNGSTVPGPYPGFQWTPVITPGAPQVDYLLRVVEVFPGQTPLAAIAGNVPVFEIAVPIVTSFVYSPSALPLENGKQYAWRVQAVRALQGETGQAEPIGANEGRSEIFTFTKAAPSGPVVVAVGPPPPPPPKPGVQVAFPLFNASLSGTLRYTFSPSKVPAPKKVSTSWMVVIPAVYTMENPGPGPGVQVQALGQTQPPPQQPFSVLGPPGPDPGPLGGVTVRLVVRYRTANAAIISGPVKAKGKTYTDNGTVIATTTTGANGNFAFFFHDDHPTGLIATNATVQWGSGDVAFGSETGASLVRYYHLQVADGHFLNPSDELTLGAGNVGDAGTLVSLVRSYRVVVRVVKSHAQTEALSAVKVQLVRVTRPPTVPDNEGPSTAWPRPTLSSGVMQLYAPGYTPAEIIGEAETDAGGRARFTRLVKNLGPSDQYRIRVSTPEGGLLYYETAYLAYAESWPGFGPQGDWATFNEQYALTKSDTFVVKLVAKKARYVGRLMRADTLIPLRYGRADLCYQYTCAKRYIDSVDNGYFSFSNIAGATTTPPFWRVDVGAAGFIPQSRDSLALLLGTQSTSDVYYLQPDAHVKGRIVDEQGRPLFGHVQVDGGAWFAAKPAFANSKGPIGVQLSPELFQFAGGGGANPPAAQAAAPGVQPAAAAQPQFPQGGLQNVAQGVGPIAATAYVFDFDAVSGSQPLRINAGPKFFPYDTTLTIPKGGPTDLGTFTVFRRLHRLRLRVGIAGGPMGAVSPPIPGAIVELGISEHPTDTAGPNGYVELVWESPNAGDSSVTVKVTGPAGKDFVNRTVILQVPESRTWTNRTVLLNRGTSIAGRVFAGPSDSVPVSGARVFIDQGSDSSVIETLTDANGDYVLHAVPIDTHVVRAGKSQSNFIGDSLIVVATLAPVTGRDFHLRYYEGIDITRLLGFPLEVHDLEELDGGRARIRGALVDLPANADFATGVTALSFDSVTIESDGTPAKHAVPVAGAVVLINNHLALDPFQTGKYIAEQSAPATGLQVRPLTGGSGIGAVYGPIVLDVSASLTAVTSAEIDSLPTAYLLKPGATGDARTVVPSLTADSSAPVGAAGWNVGGAAGDRLRFRLYGFNTHADSAASFLKADALYLSATMHTDIAGLPDLALALPALKVVPGSGPAGGVKPASDSQPISLALGVWTLKASTWYLSPSEGKVYLAEGEILVPPNPAQPQATVSFPFTGVQVTPTSLSGGNFGTGPVQLAGIVPLTASVPIKFVMESPAGPWSLTALGATIPALPGMDVGSVIELDNFSFKSDGTSGMTTKSTASVRYFHTADFAIKAIGVTATAVQLNGNFDLHVPNLGPQAFIFTYQKSGGVAQLAMPPLTFQSFDIGGASLKLNDGTLTAAGFASVGTLTVTGKWAIPIQFTRTPLDGTNQIAAIPAPGAALGIGEISVTALSGGSKVTAGQWATALDGTVNVGGNQATGPLHVEVAGADVTVGSTGLSVKNISTPFGDITITLNFPEQRIEGTLQIDQKEIAEGAFVTGSAELVLSGKPSNKYWYFFAGATAQLTSPSFGGTVAIVFGDAVLSDQLLDKFNAYSTKGVPASFHDINGFFLEGKVVVPIPICPNGAIDVGIGSVAVWCSVWGDIRLGMNFQELNTYHVGIQAGAEVGAKGGVGLGVCLHVSGKVAADIGLEGEYRSDGAWYVLGEFNMSLHGEISGGIGIDDACIEGSAGFTLALGAEAQAGYNWNTNTGEFFRIFFK